LNVLVDDQWTCGLDGKFDHPAVKDWPDLAARYADELLRTAAPGSAAVRRFGPISAVQLHQRSGWTVIVHPFWDTTTPTGILNVALGELRGGPVEFADTFELARRLLLVRQRILSKQVARGSAS
jgi:hypothetical protein